ncbi:DUF2812 domain-containing protein [Aminipila butyrica]|uniref:DUF2812 domain-containing protein n=1 Tax=Aminipila butyrica TaxID=433296 RepID=A0A858BXS0_9FIRM|nr:DUF2812 domain-containing protein [Aminipila butyrica]QIB70377.1 DUF2812 domain-containing protein [Aminipila butyrica]
MKHIFRSFNFGTLEYKEAESFLNQMAEKGYEFKSTGKGWLRNIAIFEKSERAKKMKYVIDVAKRTEWEKSEYYQFYKDSGWEKVDCFNKRLYIFAAQKDNAVPLYTDDASERNMLRKAVVNNGELLNHSFQLLCMLIILKALFFIKNREEALYYGFYATLFLCCLTGVYYVLHITAKLIYRVSGWQVNSNAIGKKMAQLLRVSCDLFGSAFLASLVLAAFYVIWKRGFFPNSFGEISLEFVQTLIFIGSVPVILVTTYLLALHPEREQLKVLNYIGAFMFFWGLIGFFSYIL